MRSSRRLTGASRIAIPFAALVVAAACRDDTAPRRSALDAGRAQADLAVLDQLFGSAWLESFRLLSSGLIIPIGSGAQREAGARVGALMAAQAELAGAVGAARPTDPMRMRGPAATVAGVARALRSANGAAGDVPGAPALPTQLLGKTFVFDPTVNAYVYDPSRTGAPANAIRFVLYAVNPVTGTPVFASEIGYADMLDEAATHTEQLAIRLRVISGDVTHVDYGLTADGTSTTFALGIDGFLDDGAGHLDFDIDYGARIVDGSEVDRVEFAFGVPSRAFRSETTVATADGVNEAGITVDVTLHLGSDRVVLDANVVDGTITATVKIGDRPFATASGDLAAPSLRGAGGHALTAAESAVLARIIALVDRQFLVLDALMAPIG